MSDEPHREWKLTPIKLGITGLVIGVGFCLFSVMIESFASLQLIGSTILFGSFGYLMGVMRR